MTLKQYFPVLNWLPRYHRRDFVGDLTAGIIVTSLLVPQAMAYALLAGLPPHIGLYASLLPPILYPLLGTSPVLAVGPVAVDSLMVATAIGKLAPQGSADYLLLATLLAFLVGSIEVLFGIFRLGFLVNFLSRSVISGFISGAALIIGLSQAKHLLGLKIPHTETVLELLPLLIGKLNQVNWSTLGLGLASLVILWYCGQPLVQQLKRRGWPEQTIFPLSKGAPLFVVIVGTIVVWALRLDQILGIKVVGEIPAGLPSFQVPIVSGSTLQSLLPVALMISLVAYMEGFGSAQALASKRREKVDANQELIALGVANWGAALAGGYPVTGGLSRSVVNFSAGANTGLASIMTAIFVTITVMFLTSLFYFLPQTCLAAIIIMAVYKLVDFATLRRMWSYDKADAIAWLVTFSAVLGVGVEKGVIFGALVALSLHLWRTSRPHIAIVGRLGQTEHFRNVLRHPVTTCPTVLAVRMDASLYFANARFLEDFLLKTIAQQPAVKTVLLVCSAINLIDASALEVLESLIAEWQRSGIELYLSEVKGPVMDKLEKVGFVDYLGRDHFFLTTDQAMRQLGGI
ncbi:solute carrier family 26 protein [Alkalinema sp. FACHB-956]|uniref:SulP family inorganic anion transporter n=1 Tax=Alkalinema sp. FACHB-956 TaxID=2692768 RepID=UPI0016852FF3|nr:solute carrier family 26 protein [Alkalinema sp. FACHB-956]MBD2329086.1 solute carrier family 26 protein [Alkalinema sp. FACHB-956]